MQAYVDEIRKPRGKTLIRRRRALSDAIVVFGAGPSRPRFFCRLTSPGGLAADAGTAGGMLPPVDRDFRAWALPTRFWLSGASHLPNFLLAALMYTFAWPRLARADGRRGLVRIISGALSAGSPILSSCADHAGSRRKRDGARCDLAVWGVVRWLFGCASACFYLSPCPRRCAAIRQLEASPWIAISISSALPSSEWSTACSTRPGC